MSHGFSGARLVVCDRGVVTERLDGFADVAAQRRWTPRTRTQVASISKQFTAAVALRLVAERVISLDDTVADVVPRSAGGWRAVQVRHLLTHTSGMPHWRDAPGFRPADELDAAKRLDLLLATPPALPPGGAWVYSSPGYVVLAGVLAAAAATPYEQLVTDLVLVPLGLDETTLGRPTSEDVALGHQGGRRVSAWPLHTMPGTGDVCCSARDLATFLVALHDGSLLPAEVHASMHDLLLDHQAPHSPETKGRPPTAITTSGYCAGHFRGTVNGRSAILHPGDNPGYQSLAAWLPDHDAVVVALSNDEDDDLERAVADLARDVSN